LGRLKAIGSPLQQLKPMLGALPVPERSRDQERSVFSPWRQLYKSARWRALRLRIFKRDLFTCKWPGCGRSEVDTSQLVADHRRPHRGDLTLFWNEGNLQTLCKPCHDGRKQRAERAADRA
jgi:5-methylcytosine-specific restriction endonuclease McrA